MGTPPKPQRRCKDCYWLVDRDNLRGSCKQYEQHKLLDDTCNRRFLPRDILQRVREHLKDTPKYGGFQFEEDHVEKVVLERKKQKAIVIIHGEKPLTSENTLHFMIKTNRRGSFKTYETRFEEKPSTE